MTAPTPLVSLLDQLDELLANATPGDWAAVNGLRIASPRAVVAEEVGSADAALIVAAVNAVGPLTAAVRAVLELAESWRYKGEYGWGAWQEGHGPDPEGYVLDRAAADIRAAIGGDGR